MLQSNEFLKLFHADHLGVIKWSHLDQHWQNLRNSDQNWYLYTQGEPIAKQTASKASLDAFLTLIDHKIRKHQDPLYCGFVFVDQRENPRLFKIFNPKLLGCGSGHCNTGPKIPHWMISSLLPVELLPEEPDQPAGKSFFSPFTALFKN